MPKYTGTFQWELDTLLKEALGARLVSAGTIHMWDDREEVESDS